MADQRAGLGDRHIKCSGCTGSAPHTRERRHPLSGAPGSGQCSRLEIPNARAGRWSDRIRRTSDSGRGPFSDVPLASGMEPVSQRPGNPRLSFFSLFAARFSCRDFCGFFFASRLRSKPLLMTRSPGARCIALAPHATHLAPFRARTQTCMDRKASSDAEKRVLWRRLVIFRLVCLARDAPQALSPGQSLTLVSSTNQGGRLRPAHSLHLLNLQ